MKEVQDLIHCYIFLAVKILAISCICFEYLELLVHWWPGIKAPYRAPVPCINGASYGLRLF